MSKSYLQSPKKSQNNQNNILTKHEVKWAILKTNKIRDLGMENAIFCVTFLNMFPWCIVRNEDAFFEFFKINTFCEEFLISFLWSDLLICFGGFNLRFKILK